MTSAFPSWTPPSNLPITSKKPAGLTDEETDVVQTLSQIAPHLRALRQTSVTTETVSKNGIQRTIHVVVKNTPFVFDIGLARSLIVEGKVLDFHHLAVDISLLYDTPTLKPVNFVKVKPCEYTSTVNERGDQISLVIKIKVLTSQHEDMLFRIRVRLLEGKTKQEFEPPLEIVSAPMKVISKPKQTRSRKNLKRKRSLNDILSDTASRIEEHQKRQEYILSLLVRNAAGGAGTPVAAGPLKIDMDEPEKMSDGEEESRGEEEDESRESEEDSNISTTTTTTTTTSWSPDMHGFGSVAEEEFALAFQRFILSYRQMQHGERPVKLRKVVRSCSPREGEQLGELLDVCLSQAGMELQTPSHKTFGFGAAAGEGGGCGCAVCPHMLELQRIDMFYTQFLATEIGAPFGDAMQMPPSMTVAPLAMTQVDPSGMQGLGEIGLGVGGSVVGGNTISLRRSTQGGGLKLEEEFKRSKFG